MGEPESDGAGIMLGFVLLEEAALPDDVKLINAVRALGLGEIGIGEREVDTASWSIGDLSLIVGLMRAPHPDAPKMAIGPFSPMLEDEGPPAHLIVTLLGAEGSRVDRTALIIRIVTAVALATPSVAAMRGEGAMFYRTDVLAQFVSGTPRGELPTEVAIDITIASEPDGRVSLLTHGMAAYDREEFLVTAPFDDAEDAFELANNMVHWVLVAQPDKQFPTGDTVGRTAAERIEVQRVDSPVPDAPQVIRLDM